MPAEEALVDSDGWASVEPAGSSPGGDGGGDDPAIAVVDVETLMARLHHSDELLAELVDLFIPECDRLQVRLEAAVDEGRCEGVERLAHTIKGSISNFSAPAATAAALRLEQVARDGLASEIGAAYDGLKRELARLVPELDRLRSQAAANGRGPGQGPADHDGESNE